MVRNDGNVMPMRVLIAVQPRPGAPAPPRRQPGVLLRARPRRSAPADGGRSFQVAGRRGSRIGSSSTSPRFTRPPETTTSSESRMLTRPIRPTTCTRTRGRSRSRRLLLPTASPTACPRSRPARPPACSTPTARAPPRPAPGRARRGRCPPTRPPSDRAPRAQRGPAGIDLEVADLAAEAVAPRSTPVGDDASAHAGAERDHGASRTARGAVLDLGEARRRWRRRVDDHRHASVVSSRSRTGASRKAGTLGE